MKHSHEGTKSQSVRRALLSRVSPIALALSVSPMALPLTANAQLDEIVVTATKREASLLDVPYNISAYDSETLERNRVGNLADISQLIAGFAFINQGDTSRNLNNRYSLRGLNANTPSIIGWFSDLSVSPVSTYVGDHPVAFPLTLNDLERVEVLRGPQGTLYGSGSLGGTIRLIPKEPSFEEFSAHLSAETSATKESDEVNYDFDGVINVPLSDKVALRVSGGYKHNGGYIDAKGVIAREQPGNPFSAPIAAPAIATPAANNGGFVFEPTKEDVNDSDTFYARLAVKIAPTENTEIQIGYHHEKTESDSQSVINPNVASTTFTNSSLALPGALLLNSGSFGYADGIFGPDALSTFPATGKYENLSLSLTPSEFDIDLVTLDVDHDFGFATLTSATSFIQVDGQEVLDATGTWINPVGDPLTQTSGYAFAAYYGQFPRMTLPFVNTHDTENWTQEIRLVSDWDKPVDYVVGYYYTNQKNTFTYNQFVPGFSAWANSPNYPDFIGGFIEWDDSPFNIYANDSDLLFGYTRNWKFVEHAVFGEATWHITDDWQITGGVRAFWQDFEVDLAQNFGICGAFCSDTGTDPSGLVQAGNSSSESDQIFKVNTSYSISDQHSVYFNWAEGFRRGGSNNVPTTGLFASRQELTTFGPDKSSNFELGAKGVLFDRIRYNTAAYFIKWSDVQVDDANSAGFAYVLNVGEAETKGFELELGGEILENLNFQVAYAFTDAKLTNPQSIDDIGFFGFGTATVFSAPAEQIPGTVKHSASWALDYLLPLSDTYAVNFHVNGSYRDKTNGGFSDDLRNFFVLDSFVLWDTSVTLASERWNATLFVDNLTNELGITGGLSPNRMLVTGQEYYHARPRTIGLRVSADLY